MPGGGRALLHAVGVVVFADSSSVHVCGGCWWCGRCVDCLDNRAMKADDLQAACVFEVVLTCYAIVT